MDRLDEFRVFVKEHPLLKDEVKKGRKWQSIYEDWVLLGPEDSSFSTFKEEKKASPETIKNVLNYIKKINPDTLTKTLGNAQKVMSLLQSFTGGAVAGAAKATGDPLFDKRFDDWY